MDIKPSFQAIRSIGVNLALRLYKPIVVIFVTVATLLLAVSIWLVTINSIWFILLIFVAFLAFVAGGLLLAGYIIIKRVAPEQTKAQKQQASDLVDKLMRVAEVTGTPKFILLFNIIKDVVAPTEKGFISSISNDSITLRRDFIALRNSFSRKQL